MAQKTLEGVITSSVALCLLKRDLAVRKVTDLECGLLPNLAASLATDLSRLAGFPFTAATLEEAADKAKEDTLLLDLIPNWALVRPLSACYPEAAFVSEECSLVYLYMVYCTMVRRLESGYTH